MRRTGVNFSSYSRMAEILIGFPAKEGREHYRQSQPEHGGLNQFTACVLSLLLGLVTSVVSLVSFLVILRGANLGDRVSQPRREENNSAHRSGPFLTGPPGDPHQFSGAHEWSIILVFADHTSLRS